MSLPANSQTGPPPGDHEAGDGVVVPLRPDVAPVEPVEVAFLTLDELLEDDDG